MISKDIIEAVRQNIYNNALRASGDNPIFDRESFFADSIFEFWWAMIERIDMVGSPNLIKAESIIYLLKQYLPEMTVIEKDTYFEIKTDNWTYHVSDGITSFEIFPEFHYIQIDRAKRLTCYGFNPKVQNPEQFFVRLFLAFDQSIPEMLDFIREVEYKALADCKGHTLRKTILKNLLKPLPINPSFYMSGDKTKCEIEIDGWTVSFCVSSEELPVFTETLYSEMKEIVRNPTIARQFGDKYSLK